MNNLLNELSKPFPPTAIIWKPGATTKDGTKCMALAYADLRSYQDRLDEVCGLDWSVAYEPWGESRMICRLTIGGITRASTGEMSASEAKGDNGGTVAEAQAFKRACAMFGLGRFIYDLPSPWIEFDSQRKRISEAGQAELDSRYRAWYARTMAQNSQNAGQNSQNSPASDDDDANQDAPATDPGKVLSRMQLTRLNVLGVELYGSNNLWNEKRPALVEAATGGKVTSSKQLTPEQADLLIAGLEKRVKEKRALAAAARAGRVGLPAMNGHSNGVAA